MEVINKILSNRLILQLLRLFLSLFYDKKYLQGKYFEQKNNGYVWAIRGILHSFRMKRHGVYWPVGKNVRIPNGRNILFDVSSVNVFQNPGGYFQSYSGHITIGKDCFCAQNVGIITDNHNPNNPDEYLPAKDVHIGNNCWLGMNVVILPGVTLGDHTTVGAGAVVTHSFSGNCVIAGNPARIIKEI